MPSIRRIFRLTESGIGDTQAHVPVDLMDAAIGLYEHLDRALSKLPPQATKSALWLKLQPLEIATQASSIDSFIDNIDQTIKKWNVQDFFVRDKHPDADAPYGTMIFYLPNPENVHNYEPHPSGVTEQEARALEQSFLVWRDVRAKLGKSWKRSIDFPAELISALRQKFPGGFTIKDAKKVTNELRLKHNLPKMTDWSQLGRIIGKHAETNHVNPSGTASIANSVKYFWKN
jgi:hypothetical protein